MKNISNAVKKALIDSKLDWGDIDMLGVTDGPGLAGSLIVGVNFANGLSSSLGIPLVGINHLEGHVFASWICISCCKSSRTIKCENYFMVSTKRDYNRHVAYFYDHAHIF